MRSLRLILGCAISLGGLILLTGCLSAGRPGIAIVNLETGQQYVRTMSGRFNELPIDVDEATKSFRTLQRTETNTILLRTVDFEGNAKAEKALRIFGECLENYGSTWEYAISPDGNRIVYLDGKSQELRMFDFTAGRYQVLTTNLTSSSVYVFVFWLPDERLLVGAHVPEQADNDKILLVDAGKRSTEQIARPRALESIKNALSYSKRYLAYWEGFERSGLEGQFVLCDLASRSRVGNIKSLNGGWLSQPRWSLDDRYLAYVEGGGQIMLYSMADRTSCVISQAATNELVFLYGFGKRHVLYKRYDPQKESYMEKPLRVLDIFNNSEREIPGIRINGDVFLVENGTRLITKVGF